MEQPKYFEYMLPELQILNDNRIYARNELIELAAQKLGITKEQKEELIESGSPRYLGRGGWGLTYLKQAGLIESPQRGSFCISKQGKEFMSKNPISLSIEDLKQFPSFIDFQNRTSSDTANKNIENTNDTPDEIIQKNFEIKKQALCDELLNKILEQEPYFFEKLVVDLVVAMGYGGNRKDAGQVTKKSGDDGIDGIINEDKLGLGKIYLQAKRYALDHPVGSPDIQAFVGALGLQGAKKGIFITTSNFSKPAQDILKRQTNISVALIDGQTLVNLMFEYGLGVTVEKKYEIKKIDTDYFEVN